MRTGEEYSELSEYGGSYGGSRFGNSTWSRTPGRNRVPAEAEDALGSSDSPRGYSRGRSGLYYSPPGTSYTIVERPSSGLHHHTSREYTTHNFTKSPRGTYLGSNPNFDKSLSNNKKRPISPEQVLRLFGAQNQSNAKLNAERPRRSPASSPASTTHQVNYRPPSYGFSVHELVTRTVTMVRDPPEGTHGFGICVKGGKEAGVGVYISRVEEGSVAEKAGLRPGDSILEVNGTPFTAITHEEALKFTMPRLQVIDLEEEYERNSLLKRQDINTLRVCSKENHRDWIISDFELFLCLHSCYYDIEKAKKTVDCYIKCRQQWTHAFEHRNPCIEPKNRQLQLAVFSKFSELNGNHHIFYTTFATPDTSILDVEDMVKLFFVYIETWSLQVGNSEGFEFVLDCKNFTWKHLAKVKISIARKTIQYVQEAFPVRIKKIHLMNSWAVIDKLLYLCKWFMSKEFYETIYVHTSLESLLNHIPKSMLPEDYGGNELSIKEMQDNFIEFFETNSDLCN